MLPDRPYDLEKLRSLDADVQFRASRVESKRLPIDSLHAHMTLKSGVLKIQPLEVGLAGGQVHGDVTLDARRDVIVAVADLRASAVELPRLFPRIKATSVGRIGGEAALEGRGNSVAQMLATADGEVTAVMGAGQVSNLLLELAGLDIAESLKFLIGKDRSVRLRCAYADFGVDEGVARTRSLAFDTTDTVILGKGSISLRERRARSRASTPTQGPEPRQPACAARSARHLQGPETEPPARTARRTCRGGGGALRHRPACSPARPDRDWSG